MPVASLATPAADAPPPVLPEPDSPKFHVYRVAPHCLSLLWPQVEPLLALAAREEHGRFTTRDMRQWFLKGEQELWVITENGKVIAAGMLRFYRHPTGKRASVWHLAGGSRAKEWADEAFRSWLEACHVQGVTEMSIVGRRGWLRYVKRYGFKETAVVLTREEV